MGDCSDITEAQGRIDNQGTDRSEPVGYGFLADIEGWLTVVTWIEPNG
jgi:hypothetical protein